MGYRRVEIFEEMEDPHGADPGREGYRVRLYNDPKEKGMNASVAVWVESYERAVEVDEAFMRGQLPRPLPSGGWDWGD